MWKLRFPEEVLGSASSTAASSIETNNLYYIPSQPFIRLYYWVGSMDLGQSKDCGSVHAAVAWPLDRLTA